MMMLEEEEEEEDDTILVAHDEKIEAPAPPRLWKTESCYGNGTVVLQQSLYLLQTQDL
jgi:hypothetical protein